MEPFETRFTQIGDRDDDELYFPFDRWQDCGQGRDARVTVWDLLHACRRMWIVVIVGMLATGGVALWVSDQRGVYFAQTDLVFLAPTSSRFPNSLNTASESLINTASIVKNRVDLGDDLRATSSASVTLVDDGIRDGTLVRLPNLGGQWANNFSQAVLDIQAVGETAEIVENRMRWMQSTIEDTLRQMQNDAGVAEVNRIHIQASPETVQLEYVQGRESRALVITLILGVGLTLGLVVFLDTRLTGDRSWRRPFGRRRPETSLAKNPESHDRSALRLGGR